MSGNVVITEVDAFMHVVLSMAEKHVPWGELVGTTERMTLYTRCRTNWGRYNRVLLYLALNTSSLIPMDNMLLQEPKIFISIKYL
jgi:hypothetical protein